MQPRYQDTGHAHATGATPSYDATRAEGPVRHPTPVAGMNAANDTAPRYEIYLPVHKGLRACMGETLLALGRVDAFSRESVEGALAMVEDLLGLCEDHLAHENAYLHPAIERARSGATARCSADHASHLGAIGTLRARRDAVLSAEDPARERALVVLYRQLAIFVAENLEHMNVEETEHTEVLWASYTDEEIQAIERELVAHIAPARMIVWLRWMLPFISRQERAHMLRGMRAGMPAEAFSGILDALKPHFRPVDWANIWRDLGD